MNKIKFERAFDALGKLQKYYMKSSTIFPNGAFCVN